MSKFLVRCGTLTYITNDSTTQTEKQAALEAISYWHQSNAMVFSAITSVTPSEGEDKIFATTSLMRELGIEWEEKGDDDDDRVYRPRLCEPTARQPPEPLSGVLRQGR